MWPLFQLVGHPDAFGKQSSSWMKSVKCLSATYRPLHQSFQNWMTGSHNIIPLASIISEGHHGTVCKQTFWVATVSKTSCSGALLRQWLSYECLARNRDAYRIDGQVPDLLRNFQFFQHKNHMGVSKNRGTPKWMVYNGKPYWNGWFGDTIIFGNTHMLKEFNDLLNGDFFSKKKGAWLSTFPPTLGVIVRYGFLRGQWIGSNITVQAWMGFHAIFH